MVYPEITAEKDLYRRTRCRLCASQDLAPALCLKPSPIGDAYVSSRQLDRNQPLYPLDVYLCKECGHAQHLDVVDRSTIFSAYNFKTKSSPVLIDHFRAYSEAAVKFADCAKGSLVVEIGSNDGTLLSFFKERGMKVLGVDPAQCIASEASGNNVETLPDFFTSALADQIVCKRGQASIICANNVYAHIDDMDDVTSGIKTLLAPDGIFILEVSYLVDMIQRMVFDTIYHEHLCYHTVAPLMRFFDKHELKLVHVERVATKGGSIRVFVSQANSKIERSDAVKQFLLQESALNIACLSTFQEFSQKLNDTKLQLQSLLRKIKEGGRTIAGFGASITVTTLIYHFELAPFIDYLVDDNPNKEGLFSPGHNLPVLHSDALYERNPDYVLLLAWQFLEPILRKHEAYIGRGKHFIVPLPEVRIIP